SANGDRSFTPLLAGGRQRPASSDSAMQAHDLPCQVLRTDRQIEFLVRDRYAECDAPVEARDKSIDEGTIEGVEFQGCRAVDPLPGQLIQVPRRILVRVDRGAIG